MKNEFNNKELKDFANSLRFQVKALVPYEIQKYDIEIRDTVYHESVFIGKQLLKSNFNDSDFCINLIQICAEWTFHISCDLFINKIPPIYHKLFIRKINIKIYRYVINKNHTDGLKDFSKEEIIEEIEKLVNKQYNYQVKALYKKSKIDKTIYQKAIKNRNIEKLTEIMNDENSFNINISLWEVIKPNFFIFSVYIAILHVFTVYAIDHYLHKKYMVCIAAIIVLCTII